MQADVKEALADEQLRMVWEHSSVGVVAATFVAILLAVILPTVAATVAVRWWLAAKLLIGGARMAQAYRYRRAGRPGGARWRRWTYRLLAVDGAVWGALGLLALFDDIRVLFTLIPTLACVAIVAAYGLQARLVATALYVGPIVGVPALALLIRGGEFVSWGLSMLAGLALLLSTARLHEKRLAENFLLRLELSRTARQREEAAKVAAMREAVEARSEFLAAVSHELRSPLQSIVSALDVLEMRHQIDPALRSTLMQRIRRAAVLLNKQLQDLLTLARGEAGRLEMRPEPFDACALIDGIVSAARDKALEKGLALSADLPAQPVFVVADPARIDQAVTNLVSNAVRYTDTGHVRVTLDPYDDASQTLRIRVADTGPGIRPELLPRLFTRYERLGSVDRSREGSGIGLSVVKTVLDHLGGTVTVDSREGVGTTFVLAIPAVRLETSSGVDAPDADGCQRVLVVDDRPDVLNALSSVIMESGYACDTAGSAALAANLLGSRRYDVALVDIEMPVKGGVELASETRRGNGPNSGMRIVAMSANSDNAKFSQWPFDAYLGKPVERGALLKALALKRARAATV